MTNEEIFSWFDPKTKKYKGERFVFLELGDSRITLSEICNEKEEFIVTAILSCPYVNSEEDTLASGVRTEEISLDSSISSSTESAIKQLVDLYGKTTKNRKAKIRLIVPNNLFLYKVSSFPKMPRAELNLVSKNELKVLEETKFKGIPVLSQSLVLGESKGREEAMNNVLLAVVPKSKMMSYTKLLQGMGISTTDISTPQLLYVYFFNDPEAWTTSIGCVELTDQTLRMNFFQHGVLNLIRSLKVAKFEDDERFLQTVTAQIRQSLLYFNQNSPDAPAERIVFSNRSTLYQNIDMARELGGRLGIPVEDFQWQQFATSPSELDKKLKNEQVEVISRLYMWIASENKSLMRFIPRESDPDKPTFKIAAAVLLFLVIWVAVLGVFYLKFDQEVKNKQDALTSPDNPAILRYMDKKEKMTNEYNDAVKKEALYKTHSSVLENLVYDQVAWLQFLYATATSKSNDMFFKEFNLTTKQSEGNQSQDGQPEAPVMCLQLQGDIELRYDDALQRFDNFKENLQKGGLSVVPKTDKILSNSSFAIDLVISD